LLELQGAYGNADSMVYLGVSYLQGGGKLDRDFSKAQYLFEGALLLEPGNKHALYYLGYLWLLEWKENGKSRQPSAK
jgi:hypothetical protein